MNEKERVRQCTERVIESTVSVTPYELRRFADILQTLAEAAEAVDQGLPKNIELVPHKRVIRFRVCDLRIVDTYTYKVLPEGTKSVLSGCKITPSKMVRGSSYCLCNDTDSKMHVQFATSEISPDDFQMAPGATQLITVSGDKSGIGFTLVDYKILRLEDHGTWVICSDTGGPKLGLEDP